MFTGAANCRSGVTKTANTALQLGRPYALNGSTRGAFGADSAWILYGLKPGEDIWVLMYPQNIPVGQTKVEVGHGPLYICKPAAYDAPSVRLSEAVSLQMANGETYLQKSTVPKW
jgi:hypothetical protein